MENSRNNQSYTWWLSLWRSSCIVSVTVAGSPKVSRPSICSLPLRFASKRSMTKEAEARKSEGTQESTLGSRLHIDLNLQSAEKRCATWSLKIGTITTWPLELSETEKGNKQSQSSESEKDDKGNNRQNMICT